VNVLADNLTRSGQPPVVFAAADGGRLLALPSAGRVLALYPPGSDHSFLWANPALASAEAAAAYFRRDGWPNPGGDRTWLAPEIELFIGDVSRVFETYAVQRALDPGRWALTVATDTELSLAQTTRLRLHRSNCDVDVRMEKVLRPAANPLPDAGLSYAGYRQITTLEVTSSPDVTARLGLWNLLQLPSPGTMLVPVRPATNPQKVFGAFADGELTTAQQCVRWHMAPPGPDSKIALKAGALTGRAGYLRATSCGTEAKQGRRDTRHASHDMLDLVVREFSVGDERDYVDALWEPPYETGWAFQACCVRNGAEQFNELEYHVPAAACAAGRSVSRDESLVWAFRGPAEAVRKAADCLLGSSH